MFAYEIPTNANNSTAVVNEENNTIALNNQFIIVYNFNLLLSQQRFFFFLKNSFNRTVSKKKKNWNGINSISENFLNSNWLEREISELHGIFFCGKKDIRNLMLQYGDTTSPMKKSYPSIGLREVFYDSITDSIVQNPVSIQF